MEQDKLQKNIKDEVLKKIESGNVSMRSKAYFIFKLGVLFTLVVFIFFISVFLLSYIIFSLNLEGSLFLIRFGGAGWYHFLFVIPWYLLLLDMLLFVILDMLLKSFRFAYNRPVVYLFAGTFFIVTLIGTFMNFTSFHYNAMKGINKVKVPLVPNPYEGVTSVATKPGTWKGYVGEINGDSFNFSVIKLASDDYDSFLVVANPGSNISERLKIGDLVFVAGTIKDGIIDAYGIKKLNQ